MSTPFIVKKLSTQEFEVRRGNRRVSSKNLNDFLTRLLPVPPLRDPNHPVRDIDDYDADSDTSSYYSSSSSSASSFRLEDPSEDVTCLVCGSDCGGSICEAGTEHVAVICMNS